MTTTNIIACSIVQILFDAGYIAYFAGGWVRDYLRGINAKEIDIATSAPPDKVCALFPKTIPVGVAFGVIIVVVEEEHFEVTTFRKDHSYLDGRHPTGVDFSTPEKDALRRDFTINGMFFDPLTKTLYDFVGGREDLEKKIIRAIGIAEERFKEDRLRMIRAIRFAAKFDFSIEKSTYNAICSLAHTLFPAVSIERVWQEFVKMSKSPYFDKALLLMHETNLLTTIFPSLQDLPKEEIQKRVRYFAYFPLDCEAVIYLLELFPDSSLEFREELCFFLKLSNKERKLMEFFTKASSLQTLTEWAYFYADPHADIFIEVQKAKKPIFEKDHFLIAHEKRKKYLSHHIERIRKHHPLLTSHHLKKAGVKPGKKMGLLLKEGEKLAIEENLLHPQEVIDKLKETVLWSL